jgi:hypothetical protein
MSPQLLDEIRVEDEAQTEIARIDTLFHRKFGLDESRWEPRMRRTYIDAITTVQRGAHTEVA